MFKSIQWKLVAMFLLVALAVIIVIGTFTINSVADFYNKDFKNQIEAALTADFTDRLTAALSEEQPEQAVFQTAQVFSARLGINSYRNYYVLDSFGNSLGGEKLAKTDNIITAIGGKVGNKTHSGVGYMDYAYPIPDSDGETRYILYIRDSKEEVYEITRNIFTIILEALVMGILLATILGFLLSRSITTPISNLTAKAEKIALGEFEHISSVASNDEIGQLINTFGYMSKTLKATLEEIGEERDKVETVIGCMTDGVMAFNQDGEVIHINPAAKNMLGIEDESEIRFDEFFASLGADISLGHFLYLDMYSTVEKTIDFNGMILTAMIAPFRSEKDKTGGVVAVWQDVTKSRKLEEMRREFVANVSHELKTPLTTVKSYTETLLDDGLESRDMGIRFLNVILGEIDRMNRLVSDLLLLSRIDYNRTDWQKEPFSLDKLIKSVIEKLSFYAEKRGHSLTYEASSILPVFEGDRDRIEQVVTNIISNAIKYTPDNGTIKVYAGFLLNEVYIKVIDNGIGIPEGDLKRVFERFYRVDKARSRASGGTGLGLSIAKEIVEAHGGTISIESKVGKGTTVIIRFPSLEKNI